MDTAGISLVESTFQAVAPIADRFSTAFYDHLFALDPSVRALFPSARDAQRQKLVDELVAIIDSLRQLPSFVARTTGLGRRHVDYGVEPHHYDLVLTALLSALGECIPDAMTTEAVVAWRRAYHLIAETMMHGAAHGAQPRS